VGWEDGQGQGVGWEDGQAQGVGWDEVLVIPHCKQPGRGGGGGGSGTTVQLSTLPQCLETRLALPLVALKRSRGGRGALELR
jgi:hypothetical protein